MRRRSALWVAVAALALVAVGLVVVNRGGDDAGDTRADLPKLPISGGGAADEASRAASNSLGFAPAGKYVPGDGLPELGGTAPAFELQAAVDEATVRRLAESLGVDGEPTNDGAGYWVVDGPERALYVNGPDGSWSLSEKLVEPVDPVDQIPHPTYVPSPELLCPDIAAPAAGDDVKPPEGCESPFPADATDATDAADVGTTPSDPGAGDEPQASPPVEPVPPAAPVDLPAKEEAIRIALDALAGTGADLEGADVTVDDYTGMEWVVTVEPEIAGFAAPGLSMNVTIGDGGAIHSASGSLARITELGDYPLLATWAALERLNEQRVYLVPTIDPADPDVATDLGGAEPMPEDSPSSVPGGAPPDIPVTDAEIVLSAQYSYDVNDPVVYLVPTYRFTAADDSSPEVAAVIDDLLAPPPALEVPETTISSPDASEPSGAAEPGVSPGGG